VRRLHAIALACALASGCATQIHGGVYSDDGPAPGDFSSSAPVDSSQPVDLAQSVDLAMAGKSCGDIVKCAIGCGLQVGACQLQCLQGASPEGLQQSIALIQCAAQNCLAQLAPDGGGQAGIFGCLLTSCGTEVGNCQGLF
jgi:hypothetical protein